MDLALSEALARVRTWETKASCINGMLLSDSSLMLVKFTGRVTIMDDVITFMETPFEFRLSLTPAMTFKYADATLEIRALGWRCCLYEPKG
jgi:hypothetical protein